jgi:hypothetical protein
MHFSLSKIVILRKYANSLIFAVPLKGFQVPRIYSLVFFNSLPITSLSSSNYSQLSC